MSLFTVAGEAALVNPFIYLFMCHGGEGAYSWRMHRTGNPTGAAVDEGMAKVTRLARNIPNVYMSYV